MRYSELLESAGPSNDINNMINMLLMSMTANGKSEIPTDLIAAEIQKRYGVIVDTSTIQTIANDLPIVSSVDEHNIVLNNENDIPVDDASEDSSKEAVADMASGGSEKPGIDTWTTT